MPASSSRPLRPHRSLLDSESDPEDCVFETGVMHVSLFKDRMFIKHIVTMMFSVLKHFSEIHLIKLSDIISDIIPPNTQEHTIILCWFFDSAMNMFIYIK